MVIRILVLMMALTGCSTVKTDTVFEANNDQAFVLLAVDDANQRPWPFSQTDTKRYSFREVDLETSRFGENTFSVTVGTGNELSSDNLKRPKDVRAKVRFAGTSVSPGNYALYSLRSRWMNNNVDVHCLALNAPVYQVKKGHVNLIVHRQGKPLVKRRGESESPSQKTLADFPGIAGLIAQKIGKSVDENQSESPSHMLPLSRKVLASYPSISAPLVMTNILNSISFAAPDRPFLGIDCRPTESFAITE